MMKTGRALLSFLLAAVMAFSLSIAGGAAAFAEGGNPAEAAQEYDFVCTRMSVEYLRYATGYTGEMQPVKDHYVAAEYDSYYVKLNADGTGYLFLGWSGEKGFSSFSRFPERIQRRLRTRSFHYRLLLIWFSERQRVSILCSPWVSVARSKAFQSRKEALS